MALTLKLPARFITDCIECACDIGDVVSETSRTITLSSTPEQIAEIKGRAEHYANDGTDAAPMGIILSARATLRHLASQVAA